MGTSFTIRRIFPSLSIETLVSNIGNISVFKSICSWLLPLFEKYYSELKLPSHLQFKQHFARHFTTFSHSKSIFIKPWQPGKFLTGITTAGAHRVFYGTGHSSRAKSRRGKAAPSQFFPLSGILQISATPSSRLIAYSTNKLTPTPQWNSTHARGLFFSCGVSWYSYCGGLVRGPSQKVSHQQHSQ